MPGLSSKQRGWLKRLFRTTTPTRRKACFAACITSCENTQGKLVRVVAGEMLDVAVDIRRSSPHFRQVDRRAIVRGQPPPTVDYRKASPIGLVALSECAECLYKVTDYYNPSAERSIRWDDPDLAIDWALDSAPQLSARIRTLHSSRTPTSLPRHNASISTGVRCS